MDTYSYIAIALGILAGLIVSAFVVTLLVWRRLVCVRKKNKHFGSIVKARPRAVSTPAIQAYRVQPQSSFQESDTEKEPGLSGAQSKNIARTLSERRLSLARMSAVELSAVVPQWALTFKVFYRTDEETLETTIFRIANDNPLPQFLHAPTEYLVQAFLLPDETIVFQTSIRSNTGSASFDETFAVPIPKQSIDEKQMRISVYEQDVYKTRMCLGHAIVELDAIGQDSDIAHYLHQELKPLGNQLEKTLAEVYLSLLYNTKNQKLTAQITQNTISKDLPKHSVYALRVDVIVGRQIVKTKISDPQTDLKHTLQCSYTFAVPQAHLDSFCLKFSIVQHREKHCHQTVAHLVVGPCMYAHGSGVEHWREMMKNMRKSVGMWHRMLAGVGPL